MNRTFREIIGLALFLAICYITAGLGGYVTAQSVNEWYLLLDKPVWTPPNWVFSPVWIFLFGCMAVAAWLVWRKENQPKKRLALSLFSGQLFFNLCWSVFFFGLQSITFALADIVILWGLILATLIYFFRISTPAGILIIPYLLWVLYAFTLNLAIVVLN